ncbi:MAG: hypothetical protein M1167_06280 [Chloroflexi bacterium]|nr:hypothetical protein [Chloroflexota bacterium]
MEQTVPQQEHQQTAHPDNAMLCPHLRKTSKTTIRRNRHKQKNAKRNLQRRNEKQPKLLILKSALFIANANT